MILAKWILLAKLHFINGLDMFLMPGLQDAKQELPEDSKMRQYLVYVEDYVEGERRSVLEKL